MCSSQNPPPCATAPKALYTQVPEYTKKARKKKLQGTVLLEGTVGTDGRTHDIRVLQPLDFGLSEQAVKAFQAWKFEPGTRDGRPVPVLVQIEISFSLY